MKCLSCGNELDSDCHFCPICGEKRLEIISRIEKFPTELKNLVDLVIGNLNETIDNNSNTVNKDLLIKCTDNVYNVPESMKGKIYAAGSVSFAPSTTYSLEFSYGDKLVQSALFKNTAVLRREAGKDKHIAIYTDQANYDIRRNVLDETCMRDISRDPVIIVRFKEDFYLYCPKKEHYFCIDGKPVPPQLVRNISVNQLIKVNAHSSLRIKLN